MIRSLISALLLVVSLAVALAGPVLAQSATDGTIPAEWSVVSNRAASVLETGRASDGALETLRAELVDWRTRFQDAQQGNRGRIETLRRELEALGAPPEEGATEPADVAARRAELNARLEELLAPVRAAQAAFTAADGLIKETDALIERRRAEALFVQEPAPLNPVNWWPAITASSLWFADLGKDVLAPFQTSTSRAFLQAQGIKIGLLFAVALLLLLRSETWIARLRNRLAPKEAESPLARVGLLAVSPVRMVLPVAGLAAAVAIPGQIGAEGPVVDAVVGVVPLMGLAVFAARWLALQAFPMREAAAPLFPMGMARRGEARFHAITLGGMLALSMLVVAMAETSPAVADYRGVLHSALSVVTGLTLLRLGHLLLVEGRQETSAEGDSGFWAQVMRLVGRALMAVGALAPLAIGAGYVNLGLAVLWPTVLTLAILVVISTLQSLVFDAYAVITRKKDTARDALTPTLVSFGLAVAAMPVFALVWGVRTQTLGEWWQSFLGGFTVGQMTLSPASFLTFVLVFVLGYMATRLIKGVLRINVLPKTNLDTGGTNAILSGTGYVGILVSALLAITTAGIDLSGLAIVAGALSVGIGFGLQTIVQNFVSGIILLIERPIKIGDWIAVNGMEGFVRQISVRSTRIETFDRQDVIIPNADLIAGVVTNYTLGNSTGRVLVPVGVAYGTDTRRVQAILQEIVEAHPMVILNPPPVVTFEGFGADSQDFVIRAVLRDVLFKVIVKSEINHSIAERFREEGIEIPFAQRDVWLRNPEVLQQQKPTEPETT